MLEEFYKGDEKYTLLLTQLSEKIRKRCKTIGDVLFDMEQHDEEGENAEKLKEEINNFEERLNLMLENIGKAEHRFRSIKEDLESQKRIDREKKVLAAVNKEGTSTANHTRKQGNVKKELKPSTNLSAEMSSQEMRIFFQDYASYCTASELNKESEDTQLAYLRLCLDPEIRIRAGTDDAKTHEEALEDLNKLCFEVYNPAINRQIEVFRINQPKTANTTQFAQKVRTMYMHSDVANANSDKIECLLVLRSLSDETILKELHKDIAKYTVSPKILMEAITALDRSAQTLDHQLNGPEKSRRMNNGQGGARCHTCQGTGHSKEQCTVSKDKLYCKNCRKKGLHNTNNYCRRQLEKAKKKNEKKDERSNSTDRKKSNTAKNPVTEIPPQ